MSDPKFWDDALASRRLVKELKSLKGSVEAWDNAFKKHQELKELVQVLKEEEQDLIREVAGDTDALLSELEKLQFSAKFCDPLDKGNCFLSINAGAGGTESCDWVGMLLRMYTRFCEKHGWSVKPVDMLPGEEAGVKNVTLLIEGNFAFGYLKAERGVHRLVRISPFDANKRRHTSFASVDVIPEIEEDVEIEVEGKDLIIDTFRASGPGGQHMQKTDSAVRITHIPTGLVVQCQNERSQHQNKETALKILKSRLYELQRQKREEELLKTYGQDKKKIEWGSQIRSYVMQPYTMVKDHRTGYETGDVNKVMDGGLDEFIEAYLKKQANRQTGKQANQEC